MIVYCTWCKAQLDERRTYRGSRFCSQVCADRYARERRNLRAGKACRLCGREARKPKQKKAVPTQHKPIQSLMEGQL